MKNLSWLVLIAAAIVLTTGSSARAGQIPTHDAINAEIGRAMAVTGAKGVALAVIDDGKVVYVNAFGARNAKGESLNINTIMYGASLTKTAFGYMVMQLVDEGVIALDTPIEKYLSKPLPDYTDPSVEDKYARWSDLKGDARWRKLTPRILLTHSSGFANFGFLEPDGKLKFHFDPGSRYAYSGDGFILLQFVLEQGLGLDVEKEMQRRVFVPLGMTNTSLMWRKDFAKNLADGWKADGTVEPHDERSTPRAAGSMDTTITDIANLVAGYARGERLKPASRAELTRSQLPITTVTQFPSLQSEAPPQRRRADLASGLAVIAFKGPQGAGFMKGGHNDSTANTWVCVESGRRCVVILSNDVRAEPAFPRLVAFILGETGTPWDWEYGDMKFWTP